MCSSVTALVIDESLLAVVLTPGVHMRGGCPELDRVSEVETGPKTWFVHASGLILWKQCDSTG